MGGSVTSDRVQIASRGQQYVNHHALNSCDQGFQATPPFPQGRNEVMPPGRNALKRLRRGS
eukprot:10394519-Alexandrium_andersonii.AAC.1